MAKQKPKDVAKHDYKKCKVEIEQYDVYQVLKIDGKQVDFDRDADTGAYVSHEAPYRHYGSVEELSDAIIDCRKEQKI